MFDMKFIVFCLRLQVAVRVRADHDGNSSFRQRPSSISLRTSRALNPLLALGFHSAESFLLLGLFTPPLVIAEAFSLLASLFSPCACRTFPPHPSFTMLFVTVFHDASQSSSCSRHTGADLLAGRVEELLWTRCSPDCSAHSTVPRLIAPLLNIATACVYSALASKVARTLVVACCFAAQRCWRRHAALR